MKMIKRTIGILLLITMVAIPLTACGENSGGSAVSKDSDANNLSTATEETSLFSNPLKLHDEENKQFCVDVPSDWKKTGQSDESGMNVTTLEPSDSGKKVVIGVSYKSVSGTSEPEKLNEYIEKFKEVYGEKMPDAVINERMTANGYVCLVLTKKTAGTGDAHTIDYFIFGNGGRLTISQFSNQGDAEGLEYVTSVAEFMVDTAVMY